MENNNSEQKDIEIFYKDIKMLFNDSEELNIPIYQRTYDWTPKNVETLFNDLIDSFKESKDRQYFIGNIISRDDEKETSIIIDGQQRITTITIFFITLGIYVKHSKNFSEKEILEIIENYYNDYIYKKNKNKNEERINYNMKLSSSVRNKTLEKYLKKFNINNNDVDISKLSPNNNYELNSKIIYKILEDNFSEYENLKSFLSFLVDKVVFANISIKNNIDEQKIFESINADGVPLTSIDLIKNYIYSKIENKLRNEIISKDEKEKIFETIENIFEVKLKKIQNINNIEIFFANFLAYDKKEFTKYSGKEFYKEFKKYYGQIDNYEEFILRMNNMLDMYLSILENKIEKLENENELALLLIGDVMIGPFMPVLYKIFENDNNIDFSMIVKNEIFLELILKFEKYTTRRYIELKQNKNYNKFFVETVLKDKIISSSSNSINKINHLFSECLSYDGIQMENSTSTKMSTSIEHLENMFMTKSPYQKQGGAKMSKHILTKIEFLLKGKNFEKKYLDDYNKWNVEHIMPQNPDNDSLWNISLEKYIKKKRISISKEELLENKIHKWGNITLLISETNTSISNFEWEEKHPKIINSMFRLSNYFFDKEVWDIDEIEKRTKFLWNILKDNI